MEKEQVQRPWGTSVPSFFKTRKEASFRWSRVSKVRIEGSEVSGISNRAFGLRDLRNHQKVLSWVAT